MVFLQYPFPFLRAIVTPIIWWRSAIWVCRWWTSAIGCRHATVSWRRKESRVHMWSWRRGTWWWSRKMRRRSECKGVAQVDQVGEVEKGLVVEVVPVVEVVDQEGAVAWNWRWRARRKWTQWRLPKGCPGKRTGGGGRSPRLGGPARGGGRT